MGRSFVPSIVPSGHDQTVYLVINNFGNLGTAFRRFADPIELPGKNLITLRDAALYITKLPKAEQDTEEWQAAMQVLLLVAEHDGPAMFARMTSRSIG
jgi:hypothetical protein